MRTKIGLVITAVLIAMLVAAIACGSDSEGPSAPSGEIPATPDPEPTQPAEIEKSSVSGTVAYLQRIALGPNAMVIVKLLDVSRADAPSITLGEQVIESPGQVPIPFEVKYDPKDIDDRLTYVVRAEIRDDGQLLFTTTTSYRVISRGNPNEIDLVLELVTQEAPAPEEIVCALTRAVQLPIEFENPGNPITTGFDGINVANCTFPGDIQKVTVVLTHVESGAVHTQSFSLPEPTAQVQLPLPDDALSIGTAEVLHPGEYRRQLLAVAVDGTTYDLTADQGALKAVTVLPEESQAPVPQEIACALTRAAQLPIEFDHPSEPITTGFDGINVANCTFPGDIEKVTVVITHIKSGAEHTQTFPLPEPTIQVQLPLPDDALSIGTAEALQPGEYGRVLLAIGIDGTVYDLTADQGALRTIALRSPEYPDQVSFDYNFENDDDGWTAGFADLPVSWTQDLYELEAGHRDLPSGLTGSGIYLQGHNRSDDLFMYLTKQVDGLKPLAEYQLEVSVDLVTNVPGGLIGIGGSPGESVFVKAGAATDEPVVADDGTGHLRISVDKGNQGSEGSEMVNIGDVAHPDVLGEEYKVKTLDNVGRPTMVSADEDGRLWLIIGTDSGFEGLSSLYFSRIHYELTAAD